MTNNTKKQFGKIIIALASIGSELLGEAEAEEKPAEPTQPPEPPATRKRGRPSGSTNAPATPAETADPTAPTQPETPTEPAPATEGMTIEALRELIAEPVKDGQGEAVKALIVKYNGTKLSDIPAVAHAAFAKDVEALTF